MAEPQDPPDLRAQTGHDIATSNPRPRGRGRAMVLTGLAVLVAFAVGATGVTLLSDTAGGPVGDGALIEVGGTLEERVDPGLQEPLPALVIGGFGDEDAAPVDLTAYRGTPMVVNFWASWCAPCVKEMPDFQAFSDEFGDRAPLLGVNVQDAPRNAAAFVEELGITYDLAVDPAGELYAEVRAFGMPTTLFVDADGMIRYRHTGPLDADDLRRLVDDHLGVSEG